MRRRILILFLISAAITAAVPACAENSLPTRITPQTPPASSAPPALANAAHDTSPVAPSRPAPDAALRDLTEFMERAGRLKDSDVEGRLALARWCRDREMWAQAAEMANQALYRDPGNRVAYTHPATSR